MPAAMCVMSSMLVVPLPILLERGFLKCRILWCWTSLHRSWALADTCQRTKKMGSVVRSFSCVSNSRIHYHSISRFVFFVFSCCYRSRAFVPQVAVEPQSLANANLLAAGSPFLQSLKRHAHRDLITVTRSFVLVVFKKEKNL